MSGPAVDPDRPNAARVYDYLLGGACNFEPDRRFAERIVAAMPEARSAARENRDFLRRAVRYFRAQGITQFLDLGSGIPTVGNVHEAVPDARVLYVDVDPIAVAHSEVELAGCPRAEVVLADMLDPDTVLDSAATGRLLDLEQPIAVLMVSVLHFVPDPMPAIRRYVEAMAPGSHLAITHGTRDARHPNNDSAVRLYAETGTTSISRDRAEVEALIDGLDLVEPGVVWTPQWHPDTTPGDADPRESLIYAVVGRRR